MFGYMTDLDSVEGKHLLQIEAQGMLNIKSTRNA